MNSPRVTVGADCIEISDLPETAQILPTGTCFDDAIRRLAGLLKEFPKSESELQLVHGICITADGCEVAHAWVEFRGRAYFDSIEVDERRPFSAPIADYRALLDVKESLSYSVGEAREKFRASGHAGPWVERYRRLCRKAAGGLEVKTTE